MTCYESKPGTDHGFEVLAGPMHCTKHIGGLLFDGWKIKGSMGGSEVIGVYIYICNYIIAIL